MQFLAISVTYALKPDNGATPVGKGELFINVNDYVTQGDSDGTNAIAAAHAASQIVTYPSSITNSNTATNQLKNMYGINYLNALGPRFMAGQPTIPTSDARPVLWAQKNSSANRSVNSKNGIRVHSTAHSSKSLVTYTVLR